ncbi:hypothetical protein JAB8_00960 [Janthinobacterium sp. HH106]|uniref:hypothetical protein n=1 Tax=Janthinobacterium sp. HH106 TaxID=1537278 RepID=UPI000875017A|nr:hypothetical protein [Janthinobacterium sp. HH106]OEZ93946.1 hypothetical protein JAB8_00960 [Janthinobacterium sp. HH106]
MIFTTAHAKHLAYTAFLMLLVAAFALRIEWLVGLYLGVALCVVLRNAHMFRLANNVERYMMLLLLCTLTLMLPLSTMRSWTAPMHYGISLLSMGAAFVLSRDKDALLAACKYSLLAALAALFAALVVTGLSDFPLENLIPDSSSNGITSYLIVLQATYSTLKFLRHRQASLVTASLTLFVCIIGYGRGSILASTAILAVNLLSYLSWRRDLRGLRSIVLGLGAVFLVSIYFADDIVDFVESNTKIGSGLVDEPRQRILTDYMNKINWASALTGADYEGTSIESDFNGNPHNSFVRAHHIFGALYLLSLAAFPLALLRRRLPSSVKAFSGSMLLIVLFRCATEPVLFPTIFDFYFFAFFFALSGKFLPHPPRNRIASS